MEDRGLYLYGVTRREGTSEPLRNQGVQPGEVVRFLTQGVLAAVVGTVPLSEFAPEQVQAHLQAGEVQWVEERALAHAAVLQELMQRGPVIPARFGIIFRESERLLLTLKVQEAELVALLGRLEGKVEWGVKVFAQEEVLKEVLVEEDPEAKALQERLKHLSPGIAYLYRKKLELSLEEKARERLSLWARGVHDALASVSEAEEVLRIQGVEQMQQQESMVFHGAYLVREEDMVRFREELERWAGELGHWGLRFDLSGPWPPYHFAQSQLGTPGP